MTTKYFRNFNTVSYKFGDNEKPVMFDDLSQYVDLIDGIKDNISFYNPYTIISGERPDTLSYKLYGTTDYYWTFYLMNDNIRQNGWPIDYTEILSTAKSKYPNRTVTTNSEIAKNFPVGTTVTGTVSDTVGTIVARRLDFGQLIIDTVGGNNFSPTEQITYTSQEGAFYSATLIKESEQYNAIHHYEDADGVWQDLPLFDFGTPNPTWLPITHRDRMEMANDDLKLITVLQASVIDKVVAEFINFQKQAR